MILYYFSLLCNCNCNCYCYCYCCSLRSYTGRSTSIDDVEETLLGDLTDFERYLLKNQELMYIRGKVTLSD